MIASRRFFRLAVPAAAVLATGSAHACWEEAGRKYGVSPYLLYAIAKTESGLNPKAINRRNGNGSYDVGLMQINSIWLPTLARYGITEQSLYEPCVNIEVGAWILAHNMRRHGASWTAVGAYNASSQRKRLDYAIKVYRNLPAAALAAGQPEAQP